MTRTLALADADSSLLSGGTVPVFQCKLITSPDGTQLQLTDFGGNLIMINGVLRTLPSTPPQLAASTLAAETLYYVYAGWNGSAVYLQASTAAYTAHPTYGYMVASTDSTLTLVGMVYPKNFGSGVVFQDNDAFRLIASYYNQPARTLNGPSNGYSTTSGSEVELSTGARTYFVAFSGASVQATASGYGGSGASSPGYGFYARVSVDNDTSAGQSLGGYASYGTTTLTTTGTWTILAEGLHFITVRGFVSPTGITGNFSGRVTGHIK